MWSTSTSHRALEHYPLEGALIFELPWREHPEVADAWQFKRCQRSALKAVPLSVLATGNPLDLSFTVYGTPVVSESLAERLLVLFGDEVQLIPADTHGERDWFVLNVLNCIDCFDLEKSKYERYPETHHSKPGQVSLVSYLHIDESRAGRSGIFRIKEFTPPVVIRADLAVGLDTEFSGVRFFPLRF